MDAGQFDGITRSLSMAMMVATLLVGSGVARAESLTCNSTPPCYGTPEGDNIDGTDSGETINALGGNDEVFAGDGNDIVNGGPGADALYGMGGSDKVSGGKGNDTIQELADRGGSTDSLFGGSGSVPDSFSAATERPSQQR